MSIDRTRELFGRAVTAMALDEGSLRSRVQRAVSGHLLLLGERELPKDLRLTFRRLKSLTAPARDGQGLTTALDPLSDDDVRRAARLIVELNSHLNPTWRLPADPDSTRAAHDRHRVQLVS
jgi:hypothetical protein